MRKTTFSAFACGVMIGVFVPVGTVSAADEHDRIQAHLGDGPFIYSGSAMDVKHESWSTPQGAQGPIRSDMTEDKSLQSEREAAQRAMDKKLFPLNAEGG